MAQLLCCVDFRKTGDASIDRSRVAASVVLDKRIAITFDSVGIYPRRKARSFRP